MTDSRLKPQPLNDCTIDPAEVEFYSKLAGQWWDATGPFWPLHRLNDLRVDYLHERLGPLFGVDNPLAPFSGVNVLDIGCGGGLLAEAFAHMGARVTGIDIVEKNIGLARVHADEAGLDIIYRHATTAQLMDEKRTYDLVLNMEVVEHVADLSRFLEECCALVAPGGMMVVATINRTVLAMMMAIIGAEYVLRWLPKGTHRWDRFVKPTEIQSIVSPFGFETIEQIGVKVNPLTRSFSLSSFIAVNYMLLLRKEP